MKYLSLFSGIGGFELGINKAYEDFTRHELPESHESLHRSSPDREELREWGKQNAICVGYSEIDKYAIQIYEQHFPNHTNIGDITTVNAADLPDFELLVGGFPCQSFSIAGKRKGFEDTRGTLFFDIARILRAKQPRLLVLENVKGLLSHDSGQTFRTIVSTLTELGYDLQWQVLNSKDFGVPQNRERVYIVGHLRGTPRPQVFPIGAHGAADTELPRHISNTLTRRYEGAQAVGTYIGEGKQHAQKDFCRTENMSGEGFENPYAGTLRAGASKSNNLVNNIRRLTPTECERLQGFPDNWTDCVSDTQRYKCCGNAVTVNVVQAVMQKLYTTPELLN